MTHLQYVIYQFVDIQNLLHAMVFRSGLHVAPNCPYVLYTSTTILVQYNSMHRENHISTGVYTWKP